MRHEKFDIIRQVRDAVVPTESAAYTALGEIGRLIHTACNVREQADLPLAVSHKPIGLLVSAAARQVQVCDEILLAHKALAAGGAILMPEIAWGDGTECPPQHSASAEPTPLRRIA